ncbi:equistatin-like [Argiope bruennichi]|uniref:Thyroglobulin type-1 domain-containing protein n=1 Tax=Argiope bruennichi TaxID=94029 RepID=A0A8T0EKH5_ARGBR|nr:equistatin-like [Argiope bruennichi]KAF8771848.1 hypothetical protein HNY73_019217 [Argiope bruennichi]
MTRKVILVILIVAVITGFTKAGTKCQDEREAVRSKGVFMPGCDADGLYSKKQCYSRNRKCWCVDPKTGEALTKPNRMKINCQ